MRLAEGGGGAVWERALWTAPPEWAVTTGVLMWGVVVIGLIPVKEVRELCTLPSRPDVRPDVNPVESPGDKPGDNPGDRDRDS